MFVLDKFTVEVSPISPNLRAAQFGATHTLSIRLHSSNDAGDTLETSVPVPVHVGRWVQFEATAANEAMTVYHWNGSTEAPTLVPDVRIASRGGLHADLEDGILSPLPGNMEHVLVRPVRISLPEPRRRP